jgi:phenylpropionate dioxygenase-like ring-hydroxylating dioxygenase large terminal subunit
MQHDTQVTLARRLFALIEARSTTMSDTCGRNPVSAYASAAVQKQENERLFRDRPLVITASCRLKEPGDYLTDDRTGVPILLVRNSNGELNAFANICRHRGARLANDCGSGASSFVCPYHGWGYNLDGKLRLLAPRGNFPGLECEHTDLVRLPVAERHGLVWVLPRPGGQIDENMLLPGLDSEMASYDFARFSHFETRSVQRPLNWKLAIDTFLESWHIDRLHRQSIHAILLSGIGLVDTFGENMRIVFPRRSFLELRHQPEHTWDVLRHTLVIYVLFPNTLVNWQGGHLEMWRMFPVPGEGPGQCVAEASLYTPDPVDNEQSRAHWTRNLDFLMRVVDKEDFELAAHVQRGFDAGMQEFITFGRHEPGLSHYHERIRQALA